MTLELSNVATLPIKLWPGMKIGQLCFFRLSSPAEQPYGTLAGSRYQGQRGPTASRSHLSFHRTRSDGPAAQAREDRDDRCPRHHLADMLRDAHLLLCRAP